MKTNKSAVSKDTVPPLEMSSDNIKKENASKEDDVTVKEEQIFIKDEEELHFQTSSAQQGCGSQDITAQHEKQDGLQCQAPLNAIKEEQMAEPFGSIHAGISAEEQNFSSDHREDFERPFMTETSSFYSGSKRMKLDKPSSDSDDTILSNDTFSPEGTDGSECDELSDEIELDGEFSDEHDENDIQAVEGLAEQGVWHSANSNERKFPFSGKEELSVTPNPSHEGKIWPIDVYSMFLTNSIIELIVRETNNYADYLQAQPNLTRKTRLNSWTPTDSTEIKKFLGIILYMGLNPQHSMESYWSKSVLFERKCVRDIMVRDRFLILLRTLHFNDSRGPSTSRLDKLLPITRLLLERYQRVYKLNREVVIDETMVPYRGRPIFRQYIPNKCHKYGCKIFKLCSPDGYTWNFEICCGRSESCKNLGSAESVVARLMHPLLGTGMTVYTDNYYTSLPLAKFLLDHKIYLCGTIRSNRKGLPVEVTKAKLKRGEIIGKKNEHDIKVLNWKNKANVLTLTTVPEHTDVLRATGKKTRTGSDVMKPDSVLDYNTRKKAVDLSDQFISFYSPLRKTRKWYRKLCLELLCGCTVVNALLIFNKYCSGLHKWTIVNFRKSIILSLLYGYPMEELLPDGRPSQITGGLPIAHCLNKAPGPIGKTRKRCVGCYKRICQSEGSKVADRKAKKVSTFCEGCSGKPFMCWSCFGSNHNH
ncbi:piggyBac transposable element-derived protein 4 isoform X2 [Hyalella azteca]|uniref:PiggyBac transposable element-derived protein 4 isoform X2 n=1 Tax=Hyalella azteca TaxID=294128 RepID=A0A979FWW1_HYAAZ|nr:piggyBac transposable element-derived protein 4 isoform X2 [Hyalella azteca]